MNRDGDLLAAAASLTRRLGASLRATMERSHELPALLTDRTFEAVIVDWDGAAVPDRQADASAVRARIEALCAAGVHVFVVCGSHVGDIDRQLAARPRGPGRLHLCLDRGSEVFAVSTDGPALVWRRTATDGDDDSRDRAPGDTVELLTDVSTSAGWAANWLTALGITGGLVLVVGNEFGAIGGAVGRDAHMFVAELVRAVVVSVGVEPGGYPPSVLHAGGGPQRFLEILDTQLARRREQRVPSIDADPAWVLRLPQEPAGQRASGALATLANGWSGSRGGLEEGGPDSLPLFAVNGMYTDGPNPELLAGPRWDTLRVEAADDSPPSRSLDLRTGVLAREDPSGLRTFRFASASRPSALALRAEGPATRLKAGSALTAPAERESNQGREAFERVRRKGRRLARARTPTGGGITVAAHKHHQRKGHRRSIERLAAWLVDESAAPSWDAALGQLLPLEDAGFDRLLAEHRDEWARRWSDADVRIEGDPQAEMAARFAVFHLLAAVPDDGEAAVGARGLTGRAYGGHVFWDADVFVLPALAAIRPRAARTMLEYRIRRLPPARAAARAEGRRGARFPWESAADGTDVTPRHIAGRRGEVIPVRTGEHQEHIVADVAWAAWHYVAWTGDTTFLAGPGRDLLLETARYWASRILCDSAGRGHIEGVMGPDEYHEVTDDNAYTNVMARWNLRRAAELVEAIEGNRAEQEEATLWQTLADGLVDGYDPERGLYEQFAGYWQLEPLLAGDVAPPPFAAELLLGAERVAGSQLIKQPDVVMLHHLLPDEVVPGALADDLAYYEPRTAHGSSLSPAIYAAQLTRAGRPDDALELFRLAAQLDLDDITGTTAGGLHLATMGGVWQALAHGFLGLRVTGMTLGIDPCLPTAWNALSLRLRVLGHAIGVRAEQDRVTVTCTEPLTVRVGSRPSQRCEPPGCTFPFESPVERS